MRCKFNAPFKLLVSVVLLGIWCAGAQAQLCPGTQAIKVNGDPVDWPTVLNNTTISKRAFAHDVNEFNFGDSHKDNGFTQGTSPNQPIEEWRWVYGNTNDKGDIENAGAALIKSTVTGHNLLFFFGDRSAFNGTAKIGFWFLLDDVHPTGDGSTPGSPFTGTHQNGDIFVLSDFTSGGGVSSIEVRVWQGKSSSAPGSLSGPLNNVGACAATNQDVTYLAPGGVSGTTINIAGVDGVGNPVASQLWRFTCKKVGNTNKDDATYYSPLFFVGVVDLGTIDGASACFQSFIMQTTTSAQNTAANVDMVAGQFSGIPQPPQVQGDEKCQGTAATASATCTGSTAQWYDANGTFLHDGPTHTLPSSTPAGTYNFKVTCKTEDGCESSPSDVSIIINANPTASASQAAPVSCNGGSDGQASVAPLGGTPPYTFLWSDGQTTQTATGLKAGNYTVTVTDSKGCVATAQASITEPDQLSCSASQDAPVTCKGACDGKATVTPSGGNGGYTYSWDNGETTATATQLCGSVAGASHTVTVTDSKGCTTTCNVLIYEPPVLSCVADKVSDVRCNGESNGSATVTPSGGNGGYTYSWDNGETGATATQLNAGTHKVTVTDSKGCTTDCEVTIGEPAVLTVSCAVTREISCAGGDGQTTATPNGGTPPYSYSLNGGTAQSSAVFSNLGPGSYTISITDANGCTATSGTCSLVNPTCAHIFPTQTTCCNYLFGPTSIFQQRVVCTALDASGKVTNATPGVFFYFGDYTQSTSSSVTLIVLQKSNAAFFKVHNEAASQVQVLTSNCQTISANVNINSASGRVTITFNAAANQKYVISVKYSAKSIEGFSVPGGTKYAFGLSKDGSTYLANSNGELETKAEGCSAETPTSSGSCPATTTSVDRTGLQPEVLSPLSVTAMPNPYNDRVRFTIESPVSGQGTLELFNMLGQKVQTVYKGYLQAGRPYEVDYRVPAANRENLIYILRVGNERVTGKLINQR